MSDDTITVKEALARLIGLARNNPPVFADPDLFAANMETLDDEDVAAVFMFLKTLKEEVIEKRLGQARTILLEAAESVGVLEDNTYSLDLDDCTVQHQLRLPKQPNDDKVKELLAKHQIATKDVFDTVPTYVLNLSKLEALRKKGVLTEDEVKKTFDTPSVALKVVPRKQTKALLETLVTAVPIPDMEDTLLTEAQKRKSNRKQQLEKRIAARRAKG